MWLHVGLVTIDISEKLIASLFRMKRIREVGRLAVTSSLRILSTRKMEKIYSSETTVLARLILHHIPEDGIHSNYVTKDVLK
jgi:hypothetical protein